MESFQGVKPQPGTVQKGEALVGATGLVWLQSRLGGASVPACCDHAPPWRI